MKSAYELAMSRLEKQAPSTGKPTEEQKRALAEIDSQYEAKIAEQRIFLEGKIAAAEPAEAEQLRNQLAAEVRRLEEEREERKERIRSTKA